MSEFKAFVFDMDGTLLDNESLAKTLWRDASLFYGISLDDAFLDSMIGTSAAQLEQSFYRDFGPNCPYNDIRTRKTKEDIEYYQKNGAPIKKGAIEVLDFLKNKMSLPLGLATSTERTRTKIRLGVSGLDKYFDFTICGDEVSETKPSPEIYHSAFDALGVNPKDAIVVEDSSTGVEAGLNSGARVVWIKDCQEIRPELKPHIWKVLDSLADIKTLF